MQALGSGQPTIEEPLSIENILMLVCWPNTHNFIKRKFYIVKNRVPKHVNTHIILNTHDKCSFILHWTQHLNESWCFLLVLNTLKCCEIGQQNWL